jgi:hypothetical protein
MRAESTANDAVTQAHVPISPTSAKEVVIGWNQGLADIMVEFQTDLRASLVASSLLSSESDIGTGPSRRWARK